MDFVSCDGEFLRLPAVLPSRRREGVSERKSANQAGEGVQEARQSSRPLVLFLTGTRWRLQAA